MKKLLSLTLILLSAITSMKAQSTVEPLKVYYQKGHANIQRNYRHNAEQLQSGIASWNLDSVDWNHYRVVVTSSSSPEGNENFNDQISERRANSLADYLVNKAGVSREHIIINSQRVDWSALRQLIQESHLGTEGRPYIAYLDSVIAAKNSGQEVKDAEVINGLRSAYHGWKYPYIRRHLFPLMRYAQATLVPIDAQGQPVIPVEAVKPPLQQPEQPVVLPPVAVPETVIPEISLTPDTVSVAPEAPEVPAVPVCRDSVATTPVTPVPTVPTTPTTQRNLFLAAKTNLLYDAVLLPNIGVEWSFAPQWSAAVNWEYTWLSNDAKHRYWRIYGGDAELRYWFGQAAKEKRLTGHHVGAYGGIVTYDIEFGGTGYQGRPWSYLFGLSYGYAMPIGRRLNLDFEIGLGYLGGKYYEYEPYGNTYHWTETKQRHWFGPTKAGVTLVWLLGHGNTNKKYEHPTR